MIYSRLLEIPESLWLRYSEHVIQTVYGPGSLVVLDDYEWAVKILLDCIPGCRRIRTIYLRGDMAYEHDGTFIANLMEWEFRCNEHRPI